MRSRMRKATTRPPNAIAVCVGHSTSPSVMVTPDSWCVLRSHAGRSVQRPSSPQPVDGTTGTVTPPGPVPTPPPVLPPSPAAPLRPRRFHGTVTLDPTRAGRDASKITDEVITHLVGLMGSSVRVTLEIDVDIPAGVPENVVRTVT